MDRILNEICKLNKINIIRETSTECVIKRTSESIEEIIDKVATIDLYFLVWKIRKVVKFTNE